MWRCGCGGDYCLEPNLRPELPAALRWLCEEPLRAGLNDPPRDAPDGETRLVEPEVLLRAGAAGAFGRLALRNEPPLREPPNELPRCDGELVPVGRVAEVGLPPDVVWRWLWPARNVPEDVGLFVAVPLGLLGGVAWLPLRNEPPRREPPRRQNFAFCAANPAALFCVPIKIY